LDGQLSVCSRTKPDFIAKHLFACASGAAGNFVFTKYEKLSALKNSPTILWVALLLLSRLGASRHRAHDNRAAEPIASQPQGSTTGIPHAGRMASSSPVAAWRTNDLSRMGRGMWEDVRSVSSSRERSK